MEKNNIKNILVSRGYNNNAAEIVAEALTEIDSRLEQALNLWLDNEEETEILIDGISLKKTMLSGNLKYPAALLSMDWIYKEPEKAKSILVKHNNYGLPS